MTRQAFPVPYDPPSLSGYQQYFTIEHCLPIEKLFEFKGMPCLNISQVPGDGRELIATVPDAVKVRAEDGRRVEATDISPFISNLPFGGSPYVIEHTGQGTSDSNLTEK